MVGRIVGVGLLAVLFAAEAPAAPVPKDDGGVKLDAATQVKVRNLQVERRDALKEALGNLVREHNAGRGPMDRVFSVSSSLLKAELDLATNAEERLAAHAAHLKVAKEVEEITSARYEAGRVTVSDHLLAKAARLEAEVGWLKAGGGKEKKK
jgi:hypothetical protein